MENKNNLCNIVKFEYVENVPVGETVLPPTTDEEIGVEIITQKESEKRRDIIVEGGTLERGIKIFIKMIDGKESYERFLSEEWIRGHLEERFGGVAPPLTKEQMKMFGDALCKRKDPVHIGTFDENVKLEEIKFNGEIPSQYKK